MKGMVVARERVRSTFVVYSVVEVMVVGCTRWDSDDTGRTRGRI